MKTSFRHSLEMMILCEMETCKTLDELNELADEITEQIEMCRQSIDDTMDE